MHDRSKRVIQQFGIMSGPSRQSIGQPLVLVLVCVCVDMHRTCSDHEQVIRLSHHLIIIVQLVLG